MPQADSIQAHRQPGPRETFGRAAVAISRAIASSLSSARDTLARGIIRAGVPPNAVTLAGPITASLVLFPAFYGNQRASAAVLIVSGAFDVLDGAVARLSKGVSSFGGYLDSIADRYSDFCILFAILVLIDRHWHEPHRLIYLVLWGLVVVGTTTTAYARARAETVIPSCKVGFMERPERTVTIILGLACANVHISLWILASMTNVIAVQRILYARLKMEGRSPRGRFWIWTYPRITSPHFVLCAIFIGALLFGHRLLSRP